MSDFGLSDYVCGEFSTRDEIGAEEYERISNSPDKTPTASTMHMLTNSDGSKIPLYECFIFYETKMAKIEPEDEEQLDLIADIIYENYKDYPPDSDIVSIRYAIIMSSGNYDAETVWRKSR